MIAKNLGRRKADPSTLSPFARALRDARVAAGKSQAALATHLGLSIAAVANAETAKGSRASSVLSEEAVRKAAAFFGCDPAPMLDARERCRVSWRFPNLSEAHAELALVLLGAWSSLDTTDIARIRASVRAT